MTTTHQTFRLSQGSHENPDEGLCIMEAVAFVAGEPHSDQPECADRGLALLLQSVNDSLGDEDRQRLIPLIPRIVGTANPTPREYGRWRRRVHQALENIPAQVVIDNWIKLDPKTGWGAALNETFGYSTENAGVAILREALTQFSPTYRDTSGRFIWASAGTLISRCYEPDQIFSLLDAILPDHWGVEDICTCAIEPKPVPDEREPVPA